MLIYATAEGEVEIVKALIRAGADPSIRDKQGRTPLDHANSQGDRGVTALLAG